MAYLISGRLVANFSLDEMCNKLAKEDIKLEITPEVVEHAQMLQELRNFYSKPMNVSSWYRTKAFNKSVGGASNSAHLDGRATDISNIDTSNAKLVQDLITAWKVICQSHNKIGGIVIYKWGMHFDSYSDKFGYKTFRLKDER